MKFTDIIYEIVLNEFSKSNTESFIWKSKEIFGDRFDYSLTDYTYSIVPLKLICNQHKDDYKKKYGREYFEAIPDGHLRSKTGKCEFCNPNSKKSKDKFINDAKSIWGNKYDYSQVKYVDNKTPVTIICKVRGQNGIHGPFPQTPFGHLQKKEGCKKCVPDIKGEVEVQKILEKQDIKFTPQQKFKDCISYKSKLSGRCRELEFDFYLPDLNTIVEFDGEFHFEKREKVSYDKFLSQVLNDREKNEYCKQNSIKIIRISYTDKKRVEEELMKGLNSQDDMYLSEKYPVNKGWRNPDIKPNDIVFSKKYSKP